MTLKGVPVKTRAEMRFYERHCWVCFCPLSFGWIGGDRQRLRCVSCTELKRYPTREQRREYRSKFYGGHPPRLPTGGPNRRRRWIDD